MGRCGDYYSGNNENPDMEIIEMAEKTFDELHLHISCALKYLQKFFPNQEMKNYYLSTIFLERWLILTIIYFLGLV